MDPLQLRRIGLRRGFLKKAAAGIGAIALADLLPAAETAGPLAPKRPHFPGKAKNVIFLFMEGGPSQYELFDEKPALTRYHGKPLSSEITKNLKLAFIKPTASVMASRFRFRPHGQCGMHLSELLPHTGALADDLCLVRSMHTDAVNHHPGQLALFTGHTQFGRPTMGAWVLYGLGSESQSLPGFVVLTSGRGTSGGASNFASGFLPSHYQGTVFRDSGDPLLYLSNPPGITAESQRLALDLIGDLNKRRLAESADAEIASRIASYELAFRMQMAGPELMDLSKEDARTRALYGIDDPDPDTRQFASNCLLARRMVERGVRFILMMDSSWDDHTQINTKLPKRCEKIDRATAALLTDLKQRGMLESTLVVWGGEFGRTPMVEIRNASDAGDAGRDHNPNAYSMWLAGGGIKGGQVIGETDELGLSITRDPVHVHDLQATILHCLGFDHTRLTFRSSGRDFRLTDVGGHVVEKMIL
ncbi:MAG: DUF1501 domain-containing protein [Bryobacteraceae bacterium]